MSSLTSIGINKNKKGFAPKISKRNVRKPNTATSSSTPTTKEKTPTTKEKTPQQVKQEQIAEPSNIQQQIDERISTLNRTIDETHNRTTVTNKNNDSADIDVTGLTQEEMEMNSLASLNRARADSIPPPLSAPSPVAPAIERPDCALENDGRPILKFECLTPAPPSLMRKSMSRAVKEDEGERVDAKIILAAAPPSSVPASPMDSTPSAAASPIREPTQSPGPSFMREATYSPGISSLREPSVSPEPTETSDPTFSPEPAEERDVTYSPSPAIIRPTKKAKTTKKTKGKEKEKEKTSIEVGISTPKATSSTTPSSKRTKKTTKSKASGKSIGIGVPSSSGTAITVGAPISTPGQSQPNEEEEEGDEMGTGRPGSKKRKGRKIFDYRLPENMRTLDDITEDPADIDNLEKPMNLFTKDIDGIVSKNFKEMESARFEALRKIERAAKMSPEELAAQKKKDEEEAAEAARKKRIAKEKEDERRRKEADGHILAESSNAVQVRLVNGQIVLDTDSLTIERTETDIDYGDGSLEVVEENSMTKKVNSSTYSKRQKSSRWSVPETEDFYDAISQFGTDFEMVSMIMPGRSRSQIRAKFNREEKLNPEKITEYLIRKKTPLNLKKYEEMAGIELQAVPDDFDNMQLG